jgi:hypothetical protein
MIVEDAVRNALNELTYDGTFQIEQIIYDEKYFGNVLAVLKSNMKVDIRFTRDRGNFWCEIGQTGEWYFIEDVFCVIGIKSAIKNNEFLDMIADTSKIIKINSKKIFSAFDTKNSQNTKSKIKTFAINRAMGMFK